MEICVYESKPVVGAAAAACIAGFIREAISCRGEANIILATGASQFEMLSNLVAQDVDWRRVSAFHLDEYIGLPITHPASFRKYLQERFADRVPELRRFIYIDGEAEPQSECLRLAKLISAVRIDAACVGVGENGHLAFNDPPADFETEVPYLVVKLDAVCRQQQVGEGWFASLDEVPKQAISMSIRQIMKGAAIVCTVPDSRKAEAVRSTVEGPVTNMVPASILQTHPCCSLFMDEAAASLLKRR
jgi:glucosamine-6-phosphate deaminase